MAAEVGSGERQGAMIAMLSGAVLAAIRHWIDATAKGSGGEIINALETLASATQRLQNVMGMLAGH